MPRWRALPDELDPQIREFASQLRRLVDRSGMSVATIADRTGYSKSSWERYLNGRLLPPRGAAQALAEVTDTDPRHLGTMWELAERAWSRSEMRHDQTMEAIQVAQAYAALGAVGDEPAKGRKRRRGKSGAPSRDSADSGAAGAGAGAGAGTDTDAAPAAAVVDDDAAPRPGSVPAPGGPGSQLPAAGGPGAQSAGTGGSGAPGGSPAAPAEDRTQVLRRDTSGDGPAGPAGPAVAPAPAAGTEATARLRKDVRGAAPRPGVPQAGPGPQ
ncbi:helix-turn-helix domain-containing protein, partial [Streptomyces boncukensis]|uniref:helix-turn-helix domain-containing protein n=1 Tax=Streptomyces boncukensis TaxID=2711219 RepID=UPI001F493454